jgi:hypothetical protein
MKEQSAASHARMVPMFHYVGGLMTIANLIWSLVRLVRVQNGPSLQQAFVAVILMILFWYARAFPLTAQDRIIRLEERLRLARLLPAELQPRIDELTHQQLIAMRFASDAELPDLARRVIAENMHDAKAIKSSIKEWRADHLRV